MKARIGDCMQKGMTKREMFKKLKLNPTRFYAIRHRKDIPAPHKWCEQEEQSLISNFARYPFSWDKLAAVISTECSVVLVGEQVKNKFYRMKNCRKYRDIINDMRIPERRPGRKGKNETTVEGDSCSETGEKYTEAPQEAKDWYKVEHREETIIPPISNNKYIIEGMVDYTIPGLETDVEETHNGMRTLLDGDIKSE